VIDEIQHLLNSKNDPDEILNFLVTLVNTISVPTILIGTYKALKVLQKDFRQARRAASEGAIFWDRMSKNEEWDFFLDTMWKFQWTKNPVPLTPELNDAMYEESQGITAIAVNLFMLAQEKALALGVEMSVPHIKATAKRELCMVRKMIDAIKDNNHSQIAKYDDIAMNISDVIASNSMANQRFHSKVVEFAKQSPLMKQSTADSKAVNGIVKPSVPIDIKSLRHLHKVSAKDKLPVYDVLKQHGFIKSPETDFYGG